ncbi:hypothetical protein JHK87_035610 [Glycine soja]|nr:hypothetical protein JHK87_035610 [Glycine soja]
MNSSLWSTPSDMMVAGLSLGPWSFHGWVVSHALNGDEEAAKRVGCRATTGSRDFVGIDKTSLRVFEQTRKENSTDILKLEVCDALAEYKYSNACCNSSNSPSCDYNLIYQPTKEEKQEDDTLVKESKEDMMKEYEKAALRLDKAHLVPPIIDGFHHGYAMGTLNFLSWILASGYKDGRNNVTSMSVKPTNNTGDKKTNKVFEHVKLHQGKRVDLQYLLLQFFFHNCFTNN